MRLLHISKLVFLLISQLINLTSFAQDVNPVHIRASQLSNDYILSHLFSSGDETKQSIEMIVDRDVDLRGKELSVHNLGLIGEGGKLFNFNRITVYGDLCLKCVHIQKTKKGFYVLGNVDVDNCEFSDFGAFCVNSVQKDSCINLNFSNNYCHNGASKSRSATTHVLQCFSATGKIICNTIEDVGSPDDKACNVLRIGDRDGNEKIPAYNVEIAYNHIKNICSKNTIDRHVGGCNAISAAGTHISIHDNNVENVMGWGYDREAIYCKIDTGYIYNNTVFNGGSGQGSICLKSRDIEVYGNHVECSTPQCVGIMAFGIGNNHIHNNIIKGSFKNGIRLYKDFCGLVEYNKIDIDNSNLITTDFADSGKGGISKKKGVGVTIIRNNNIKISK